MLRRCVILFNELTGDIDLSDYRAELDATYDDDETGDVFFRALYAELAAQGFEMIDYAAARAETIELRRFFDAQMEFLIDTTLAPRGFWVTGSATTSAPCRPPSRQTNARPTEQRTAILVDGEMAEWTIASVLKTVEPARVPGVRIPLSPPKPQVKDLLHR